jgi:tRNA-2-methylthio-N6-dimethylallyladenosine synthase
LPVQSGSTRILQAMRRRHTREDYFRLLDRLREEIPDITVSTDMIVGFPGETAADFEDTLTLTERAQYISMFSFKYSPRPNTLASKRMRDDVSDEEKTARIVQLQALQREIQTRLHQGAVGSRVDVLVDSISRRGAGELSGRTPGNIVVSFPAPAPRAVASLEEWLGVTAAVRVTRSGPHSVYGELEPRPSQDSSC